MNAVTINSMSVEDTMTRSDTPNETETYLQDYLRRDEDETRNGTQDGVYTQIECLAGLIDISVAPTSNTILKDASHGLGAVAPAGDQTYSLAATPAQSQSACMLVEKDVKEIASSNLEKHTIQAGTSIAHEKFFKGSVPAAEAMSGLVPATGATRLLLTTDLQLTASNLAFAHWHASASPDHNQLFTSALEELNIDLSAPPFVGILPRLEGLHPMTRFEREE